MKSYNEYLHEDVKKLLKEPSSLAGKEARQLKLDYYGFGKYGKNGTATHVVVNQHLVPINRKPEIKNPKDKEHEDVVGHSKGLKNNKELTKMKKERPDSYKKTVTKASERLKQAAEKQKGDEAVYKTLDQSEPEFEKFVKEKVKESDDLHKKMVRDYDWRGMTDPEKQTLLHYSKEGYKEINSILASGKKPKKNTHHDQYLRILDGIMDKTDSPTNFHTYAGFTGQAQLEYGEEYIVPTFRSTTTNIDIALAYLKEADTKQIIQFNIKKGQQGFYMDGNNSEAENQGEREFLLPRDTKIKVVEEPRLVHISDENKITFYECVIVDKTTGDDEIEPTDNIAKT